MTFFMIGSNSFPNYSAWLKSYAYAKSRVLMRSKIILIQQVSDTAPMVLRARGYKTFFVLNSVEHEILNAHKYKDVKKIAFLGSGKHRMLFFLLINVKMPTIVGILTFMSRNNFMLS